MTGKLIFFYLDQNTKGMKKNEQRKGFNTKSGAEKKKSRPRRNYSHRELMGQIDRYTARAKTGKDLKAMTDLKLDYLGDNVAKADARVRRDVYFHKGKRAEIHPGKTAGDMRKQDNERDQADRNEYADLAKTYYHRNYSLSKAHKEAVARSKIRTKGKGMDKG